MNGDYTSLRSVDEPPADGTVSIVTEGGAPEEDFAATTEHCCTTCARLGSACAGVLDDSVLVHPGGSAGLL